MAIVGGAWNVGGEEGGLAFRGCLYYLPLVKGLAQKMQKCRAPQDEALGEQELGEEVEVVVLLSMA